MDGVVLVRLVGGGVLLVVGAEALVRGASRLAVAMGITPLAIGLTVVAAGTSLPELATSVAPDGLAVADTVLRADLPLSLLATLVVLPCLVTGLIILRWEGALLLACYGGYLAVVIATGAGDPRADVLTRSLFLLLAVVAATLTTFGWWSGRGSSPPDVPRPGRARRQG